MPLELVKAHQALDRAVDAAYGKTAFKTEAERVAFLFERYQQLIAPLVVESKTNLISTDLPLQQLISSPLPEGEG